MFQLAYISFVSDFFDKDEDKGISEVLETANSFNRDHNLSGMLLFKGGIFIQILEGDKEEVTNLFGKIAMDLRHEGLKILVKQEVNERLFSDWTMAYKKIEKLDLDKLNTILSWQKLIEDTRERKPVSNEKIMEIFKVFRYQL